MLKNVKAKLQSWLSKTKIRVQKLVKMKTRAAKQVWVAIMVMVHCLMVEGRHPRNQQTGVLPTVAVPQAEETDRVFAQRTQRKYIWELQGGCLLMPWDCNHQRMLLFQNPETHSRWTLSRSLSYLYTQELDRLLPVSPSPSRLEFPRLPVPPTEKRLNKAHNVKWLWRTDSNTAAQNFNGGI